MSSHTSSSPSTAELLIELERLLAVVESAYMSGCPVRALISEPDLLRVRIMCGKAKSEIGSDALRFLNGVCYPQGIYIQPSAFFLAVHGAVLVARSGTAALYRFPDGSQVSVTPAWADLED